MFQISLLAGVLASCTFFLGFYLGGTQFDRLDVNRDGQANITDLSVLAFELNKLEK